MKSNVRFLNHPDMWMFTVVVIWGINSPMLKLVFNTMNPWAFTGIRFVLIGLLSLLSFYLITNQRHLFRMPIKDHGYMLLAAGFAFGGYQFCLTRGLSETPVFLASLLVGFSPIFSILIATVLRLERYPLSSWLGMFIAFLGIVIFKFQADEIVFSGSIVGELFCLGSALCWASYSVLIKSKVFQNYSGNQVSTLTVVYGMVIILFYSLPDILAFEFTTLETVTWLEIGYTVVFPIFLAYKLYNASIQTIGVDKTVIYIYLVPIFAGVFAFSIGLDDFTLANFLGALVVITGMMIARKSA